MQTSHHDIHPQLDEALRFNRIHGSRVFEFYDLWAMGANAVHTEQSERAPRLVRPPHSILERDRRPQRRRPGLLCAAAYHSSENRPNDLALCIDIFNSISRRNESPEPRFGLLAANAEDAWLHGKIGLAIAPFKKASEGYRSMLPSFRACVDTLATRVRSISGR
ncbi:hypothetical protein [Pelagicoccus sp. SDUM812002]|uniref:hypothetical protein n=1 Tax=Pelagicoccus sp. SDUM812002 TaxID=3041266 RepID=UPI00280EFD2E|nr:hypothetical protein [Pelagicoccus sp. SDUM812002]MDQ8185401.1 hypothetical protein [Pelagicoccus sp. SDUM812002]